MEIFAAYDWKPFQSCLDKTAILDVSGRAVSTRKVKFNFLRTRVFVPIQNDN
jgi:hypothetical protein